MTDKDYKKSRNYWKVLKYRLNEEGSELVTKCNQLKMKAKDGKYRLTDTLDTKGIGILRLIQSILSRNAEPFKLWLANIGKDRIDEVFNPELAINRAVNYYRLKGYDDNWIRARLNGIVDRLKLTDSWKEAGINKPIEYAILTNTIYKEWSDMTASEYKEFKGLRKESLRDNMTDVEIALTNLGEVATRELVNAKEPYGFNENKEITRTGGKISKVARNELERELGRGIISKENRLDYKYKNERMIDGKTE